MTVCVFVHVRAGICRSRLLCTEICEWASILLFILYYSSVWSLYNCSFLYSINNLLCTFIFHCFSFWTKRAFYIGLRCIIVQFKPGFSQVEESKCILNGPENVSMEAAHVHNRVSNVWQLPVLETLHASPILLHVPNVRYLIAIIFSTAKC